MTKHPNELPPFPFPVGTMVSGHYDGQTFAGRVEECPGPNAIVVRGRRLPAGAVTSFERKVAPAAAETYDLEFDLPDEQEQEQEAPIFDYED